MQPSWGGTGERLFLPLGLELVKDSFYLENREYLIGRGDRDARDEMPSRLASPIEEQHRPSPYKHLCLGLGFRAQGLGTTSAAKTTVSIRSGVFQRFRVQGSGFRVQGSGSWNNIGRKNDSIYKVWGFSKIQGSGSWNGIGRFHKHQQGFGTGFKIQGSGFQVQGSESRV